MCSFRWCGRQLCLRDMPISGVNSTPRPTAVYASDPASPRRPQDSLPSRLLGFERTRLSLASSFQLSSRTPHPALGQDLTPSSRATPSAASEHLLELIGCPISMSFATFCVCLELRLLPSTGVTRFPRCRVGGGALSCLRANLRPPLKLDVQFSSYEGNWV